MNEVLPHGHKLRLGNTVKHIKRGSLYKVVGRVRAPFYDQLTDGGYGYLLRDPYYGILIRPPFDLASGNFGMNELLLKVWIQISEPKLLGPFSNWLLYQGMDEQERIYARLEGEFTDDRFEVLREA